MNDEAAPHYEDQINNMMYGHQFLKDEFGITPTIGWHVDPFGHSST
jgi:alpha-mannosidase